MTTAPAFDASWIPAKTHLGADFADDWDEIPDGRGNNTLAALGGAMRKQGASYRAILRGLLAYNRLFMERDPMPKEMVEQIARSVSRYAPDPDPDIELVDDDEEPEEPAKPELTEEQLAANTIDRHFVRASQMGEPSPRGWLWKPYLPAAELTMLEGQEGIGKGMTAAWLTERITTGEPFTVGGEKRPPQQVIWFSAEDDPEDDIQPRLAAQGYIKGVHAEVIFQRMDEAAWTFPKMMPALRRLVAVEKPGLIVVDPGRFFLNPPDGVEGNNNNELALRPGMVSLMHIARDLNVAVLFVHHQNKMGDGDSRQRSSGSGVLRQVARHVVTMEMVGANRAMSVEKANHMDKLYNVASYEVKPVDGTDTAAFVPGGHLPEYKGIDEWRKVMGDATIKVEITTADVVNQYDYLDCDDVAPSVKDIAHDLGIEKRAAKALHTSLVSAKIIVSNKWRHGCDGGVAEGAEK